MNKTAIIFGGAFNPPTVAHQIIFQATVDYASSVGAEVWLLPSGNRTDKTIPVTRSRRIDYIEAMVNDLQPGQVPISVVTSELDRKVPVETYDTHLELLKSNPGYDLVWVFGADSTQTMQDWKQGNWLIQNMKMLLVTRPGSDVNFNIVNFEILEIAALDVSSTELRRRIEMKEPFDDITSPSVARLLKVN